MNSRLRTVQIWYFTNHLVTYGKKELCNHHYTLSKKEHTWKMLQRKINWSWNYIWNKFSSLLKSAKNVSNNVYEMLKNKFKIKRLYWKCINTNWKLIWNVTFLKDFFSHLFWSKIFIGLKLFLEIEHQLSCTCTQTRLKQLLLHSFCLLYDVLFMVDWKD